MIKFDDINIGQMFYILFYPHSSSPTRSPSKLTLCLKTNYDLYVAYDESKIGCSNYSQCRITNLLTFHITHRLALYTKNLLDMVQI